MNNAQTCVLNAIVGQALRVDGQMTITATASSAYGSAYDIPANVQVSDPAFFLDPITLGATYSSASGTNFESTPEPSTFWLAALGGLVVGCTRSARRRLTHQ